MFSVLILTRNEEQNLSDCLASVKWCDDIVVLDSLSTDGTVAVARSAGARVVERSFDDFATQRNYALDKIPFQHPWVFHLDADERFTKSLQRECETVIAEDQQSGFLVPSRLMFMDKWLRWSGMYPVYQMRLMKLGEIRFIQAGHGQREAEAKRGVSKLREPYLHYNFSKGLDDWREKHDRYSTKEAEEPAGATEWADWLARPVGNRSRGKAAGAEEVFDAAPLPSHPAFSVYVCAAPRLPRRAAGVGVLPPAGHI